MNENPYQAPKEVLAVAEKTKSLEDNLRQYRQSRRRWSAGCWLLGGVLGLLGILGLIYQERLASPWRSLSDVDQNAEFQSGWMLTSMGAVSVTLILLGAVVFVLGPISWFWFRRRVRSGDR